MDETLVPRAILEPLPEPIAKSSVDYTDAEGNYYLFLAVSRDAIDSSPYEVWLVNGEVTMYIRRYVQIQVNGVTYYREKNNIGYYGEFLTTPLEPFEIVEEVVSEVEEMNYIVNLIQDGPLRGIIRHYIAYLEKLVAEKDVK